MWLKSSFRPKLVSATPEASFASFSGRESRNLFEVDAWRKVEGDLANLVSYLVSFFCGVEVVEHRAYLTSVEFVYCSDSVGEYHSVLVTRRTRTKVKADILRSISIPYKFKGETESVLPKVWGYLFLACGIAVVPKIFRVRFLGDFCAFFSQLNVYFHISLLPIRAFFDILTIVVVWSKAQNACFSSSDKCSRKY